MAEPLSAERVEEWRAWAQWAPPRESLAQATTMHRAINELLATLDAERKFSRSLVEALEAIAALHERTETVEVENPDEAATEARYCAECFVTDDADEHPTLDLARAALAADPAPREEGTNDAE